MAGELTRHPSLDERFDAAVKIVDYDAAWPLRAAEEMQRIREGLGSTVVRLEHVGSTSVRGLAAKPIIDLQLSVASIEPHETYVPALAKLGYLFTPDPDSPDYHAFALPHTRPRTHHLHVCETGSEHERRHIAVRDYLRSHPGEAKRYGDLKRAVVAEHPRDRLAYIAGKDAYVAALERRALAWARGER